MSIHLNILSVKEMQAFASQIASCVHGGEVLELVGDVGAGKTTFTKALAAELGVGDTVQSPTFTISAVYAIPSDKIRGGRLAHYDFYRLTDPGVMRDELAEAMSESHTVVVIEWADVVSDVLPDDRLTIYFDYVADESARRVRLEPRGPKASRVVKGVAE